MKFKFCSNPMIVNLVNAEEVTKAETKTIRQIFLTSSWNPLTCILRSHFLPAMKLLCSLQM
uniref:Uncharacterized protein n=1 Tax=Brassica oleracea TaxID=3712 RepID=A0A3P6BKX0_BRAOL|nr:unnamed protein product [Brassica oleracea]